MPGYWVWVVRKGRHPQGFVSSHENFDEAKQAADLLVFSDRTAKQAYVTRADTQYAVYSTLGPAASPPEFGGPSSYWEDNAVQFRRLISELAAAGGVTSSQMHRMKERLGALMRGVSDVGVWKVIKQADDEWQEIAEMASGEARKRWTAPGMEEDDPRYAAILAAVFEEKLTPKQMRAVAKSMDLPAAAVRELLGRAFDAYMRWLET